MNVSLVNNPFSSFLLLFGSNKRYCSVNAEQRNKHAPDLGCICFHARLLARSGGHKQSGAEEILLPPGFLIIENGGGGLSDGGGIATEGPFRSDGSLNSTPPSRTTASPGFSL